MAQGAVKLLELKVRGPRKDEKVPPARRSVVENKTFNFDLRKFCCPSAIWMHNT